MTDNSWLFIYAIMVILVAVVLFSAYRSYSKLPPDSLAALETLAVYALKVVDQSIDEESEQERLSLSLQIMVDKLSELGVSVSEDILRVILTKLIEEAHKQVD